jgi:hypothetical protein
MVHGYKYKLTQTISPKPTFAHSFFHNVFLPNHLCDTRYMRKKRERKKTIEMILKKGKNKPQQ